VTVDHPTDTAPLTVEDVTPGWLNECLRAAGHEVEVAGFAPQRIGNGLLGIAYRLRLRFAGPDRGDAVPRSLVLKYATSGARSRRTGRIGFGFEGRPGFFEAEVIFYRHFARRLSIRTPRCYASWLSPERDQFTLLLEDVAPASAGDEFGVTPPERVAVAVAGLAGLHAAHWDIPAQPEETFLTPPTTEEATRYGAMMRRNIDVVLERELLTGSAVAMALIRLFGEHADEWYAGLGRPASLIHGDFRLDNLLFPDVPGDAYVAVDWQTFAPGHPARDVGLFLGASIPTDLRRRHQERLLRAYHEGLVGHGVTDQSFTETAELLRVGVFHALHNVLTILRTLDIDDRGSRLAHEWLARSVATADDLDSWSVFR
jgi:aminoglycoside phosphotransferase (APT) family kinase protein